MSEKTETANPTPPTLSPLIPTAAVFVLALVFYLVTLQPSLSWGDGVRLQREAITSESFILTELVDVAFAPDPYPFAKLGVAAWDHPLYVIVGHTLVRLFPGVDSLWLVNLVSAVFGAGAVAMLFLLCYTHTRSLIAALYGSLALAVSHTFWFHAATPEVYTLFAFLLLLSLTLYDLYEREGRQGALIGSAFALGLGGANHMLAFLALPAALLYHVLGGRFKQRRVKDAQKNYGGQEDPLTSPLPTPLQASPPPPHEWRGEAASADHRSDGEPRGEVLPPASQRTSWLADIVKAVDWRLAAWAGLAFLVGFSPYLIQLARMLRTFPLAEVSGPVIGSTFIRGLLSTPLPRLLATFPTYLMYLFYQFGPFGVALGVYGFWKGRASHRHLWLIAISFYAVYTAFGLAYQVSDQFAFFLGSHLFFAGAMALGAAQLLEKLSGPRRAWLAGGLALLVAAMPPLYEKVPDWFQAAGITDEAFGIPQVGVGVRDGLDFYLNPNRRGDDSAYQFGVETMESLPPDAVVIAQWYTDTDEYFVLRFFAAVEGLRPDVEIDGWPREEPIDFDSNIAVARIESALAEGRAVYLASLSERYYQASALVARYCIAPEGSLYRVHPESPEEAVGLACVSEVQP
jgi:hypothetical protein